ncbi:MAG TPA: molybdopterin-dependent oxidoreductase [Rhodocyclaceae bacterium]|nr:molybdopterin-dependent oxidoreductase [Rhodocyclaceae bacterium]
MPSEIKSTCCYCGVGCGVIIEADGDRIVGVRGDPDHPANFGRLCTKGASLHLSARPEYRLLRPELRSRRGIPGRPLAWEAALDHAAGRFADIIRAHGPDAVAFYISGQLLTEDYYVFNKLAKGLIGTNNVDSNSRLCMSSAVAGYKQTLGADAPPCCYEDIAAADLVFIAGANPAVAHPILFRRLEDAKAANPDLRIIVSDPRRSESAAIADHHLPLRPGTDIALLNSMLHVLVAERLIDSAYIAAHTRGFEALTDIVAAYPPAVAADICGLPAEDIVKAARCFGSAQAALSLYCQGLNQSIHGTHNNAALTHLHLATGQIGRPGAGPFSLTGQPNAMGGREVGGLANLLSAHRDLANPDHRAEVARLWGLPDVPARPGKTAMELFQALKTGEVKAVWIACTNPAHSMPFQALVREGLAKADFVVLQEACRNTDTAPYADLLLPAATWGEKEGTVTNSERRISRVRRAVPPPGEARPDWETAADFGRRLALRLGRRDGGALFPYADPEAVFNEHRETTRGRDLDITGLSYDLLETAGPQQWPLPAGQAAGTPRLYTDGRFPTADGRARFVPVEHQGTHDHLHPGAPLSLLSGRLRDHWHGLSRTGTVPRLFNQDDEPCLAMHPCDMRHRQLEAGDLVRVGNGRGEIVLPAVQGIGLRRGTAWLPMHWGSRFLGSPGANALTPDALDPHSLQPELKHAAVRVEKANLAHPLAVVRRCADVGDALALKEAAEPLLAAFPYASLSLYGRNGSLVVFRAAAAEPCAEERLGQIDEVFGLAGEEGAIVYADRRRSISKRAIARQGLLLGVRLAGETRALGWLKEAMAENQLDVGLIRFALAPTLNPPTALARRAIVCKCADVSDLQIDEALSRGSDLEALQAGLKCGTFCGSCLPEIKRMAGRAGQAAA